MKSVLLFAATLVLGIQTPVQALESATVLGNNAALADASGFSATYSNRGDLDLTKEFFQALGNNGRTCASCHVPEQGWSVTPAGVQQRFKDSAGKDPIFRSNDGSNSTDADVSTLAKRKAAYSQLLNKGVIRISLKVPEAAEFTLVDVSDPYRTLTPKDLSPDFSFSLFRRPLPATNLKFLSAVMWDGRETIPGHAIAYDLRRQANNATLGHAQASTAPSRAQLQAIVGFERALFTAQVYDNDVKNLTTGGAKGGALALARQDFYPGINDLAGDSKTGLPHNGNVFSLYQSWDKLIETAPTDIRAAIARGQKLFNSKAITISGVPGLNDAPELGSPQFIIGSCSTCHDAPNVGSHSLARFINIGVSDETQRTGDMPLYSLRNNTTTELAKTTDPGRALITGQWRDIGRFKVPSLRGLAARPPYFHNGMAQELGNVVDFYDRRFHIGFDNRERLDLILFLRSL